MRLAGDLFFWTDGACPKDMCIHRQIFAQNNVFRRFSADVRNCEIPRIVSTTSLYYYPLYGQSYTTICSRNDDEEFNNLLATRPAP